MSVKMTVKKTDTGDAGLFYLLFCTVYCNENRLKYNMTPYEPHHEKTCLGTDRLIFWGGRGGGGAGFFPQDFLPIEKQRFFFSHSPRAKIFFSGQSKNIFFFSKQHIYSKCILLDLYVRVFLEPKIHGYIVYMFVYTCILDIWVRVYMSRDMTKPTKWLCAQRRLRSAWASAQSNQSLRCSHEVALGP